MKISTAMLVVTCLGIAACPDRGAAQGPYYPGFEQWLFSDAPPHAWGSAEYLLGFRKSRQVPALVTANPAGTPLPDVGVLDAPSTTILFGGGGLDYNPSSGVRGEAGIWLDGRAITGIGVSFTGLQQETVRFSAESDGSPGSDILSRPIFNTLLDQLGSQLVAYPGLVAGRVNVQAANDVYGAEIFLRREIDLLPPLDFWLVGRCDFIIGYQLSRMNDSLAVTNNLVSLNPAFLGQIGTTLDAFDSFHARNEFHGVTLGLKYVADFGPLSLTMLGKVGLGNMHQSVTIDGHTVITVPLFPSADFPSGLLAQPSNIGSYEQDRFGVIPEARIALTYNFCPRLSVGVGYNFIYWNSVAYAGDQINTRVDVTQALPDPAFDFRERDSFVHAVTFFVQLNN